MNIKNYIEKQASRYAAADKYVKTLYACNAVNLVGGTMYGLYYGIFLYRSTFSLSVLAIDGLLSGIGVWLGYVLGVTLIRRTGYSGALKIAFGGLAFVSFATALIAGHIADWFMVIAVLRTIPAGIYTAVAETLMVRDVHPKSRESFLQIRLSLEFLASIVLPTVIGALVSSALGYEFAFVVAGLLYVGALFMPIRLPKPEVTLSIREVLQMFRRPLYKHHAANRTAAAAFNKINGFVVMIIPFLMLNDELQVGMLTSAIAVVAALVSLWVKNVKPAQKLRFGYGAFSVRIAMSVLFVSLWTAPIMMLWQLVNKVVTPLHDPLQQGLDFDNDSLIMGSDLRQKALHINVLNNTLLLFGSTAAYASFLLIISAASNQQQYVLQLLIIGFALWRFINLFAATQINRKAKSRTGELLPVYD